MEPPKLYDIKDAARYLGVAASTLRYWEAEGLIRAERNSHNDYRQYTLHDLIDASDISFYRKLGVPVKALKDYPAMSLAALDSALLHSDQEAQKRISELEAMRKHLSYQRSLIAQVEKLKHLDMRPSTPTMQHLSVIDYDDPRAWTLLADESWRYGAVIAAQAPHVVQEAMVDAPLPHTETLWEYPVSETPPPYLECLLYIETSTEESNAEELFEKARQHNLEPTMVIGAYLLTATEEQNGRRQDYYRAWIF